MGMLSNMPPNVVVWFGWRPPANVTHDGSERYVWLFVIFQRSLIPVGTERWTSLILLGELFVIMPLI